jgi:spore coat polysaccharide biosynthesis protein SpsF (cytidylyltransferase family)
MTTKVLIAVQARSGSTRLPGKWKILINGVSVMDRVISAVQSSANYMNNGRGDIHAQTCLVVPFGDEIAKKHGHNITVFEGPEADVLRRYYDAANSMKCDYIVRITGDCPMLPAPVITDHVSCAVRHEIDYLTNAREDTRLAPDGHDVEVISRKLLDWCQQNAFTSDDREHVTTLIKRSPPKWADTSNFGGWVDDSHLKLSIDTQEDVEFVRTYDSIVNRKLTDNRDKYGGVFRK